MGQCLVEMMVNPPKPGDESFEQYDSEYKAIKAGLKSRATSLYDAFQGMESVEVGEPQVSPSFSQVPSHSSLSSQKPEHKSLTYPCRAQCICSPQSTSRKTQSKPPKTPARNPTTSTVSVSSMQRGSASCLDQASVRRQALCISERRSWRPARSGWAGGRSSIGNLWRSIDEGERGFGSWKGFEVDLIFGLGFGFWGDGSRPFFFGFGKC